MEEDIKLTYGQMRFLEAVGSGRNIFLTGKAGTGKTFIVKKAQELLKKSERKFIAVAPTGIAANNIEGQTIHSMFRVNPFGVMSFEECQFIKKGSREVLRKSNTIIIDEVSMLRPDLLDAMHWTMRKNGLPGLDKKQIIFVGDMAQLPPILDDNSRTVLYESYEGETFQFAEIYKRLDVLTIELDEVMRQTDVEFINALNTIREGGKHPYFKQFVHKEPRGVVLAPYNSTVDEYNQEGLKAQAGELFTFTAILSGNVKPQDFNFENQIKVKDGCKIMYLANSENNPLRNGTLGTFVSKEITNPLAPAPTGKEHKKQRVCMIRVGNVEYVMDQVTATKKEYVYDKASDKLKMQELGSITQFPFKLAYALSIHKAQGLTFDECTLDLRRPVFMKQQMYVALSRVRTPEGLRIII